MSGIAGAWSRFKARVLAPDLAQGVGVIVGRHGIDPRLSFGHGGECVAALRRTHQGSVAVLVDVRADVAGNGFNGLRHAVSFVSLMIFAFAASSASVSCSLATSRK